MRGGGGGALCVHLLGSESSCCGPIHRLRGGGALRKTWADAVMKTVSISQVSLRNEACSGCPQRQG